MAESTQSVSSFRRLLMLRRQRLIDGRRTEDVDARDETGVCCKRRREARRKVVTVDLELN